MSVKAANVFELTDKQREDMGLMSHEEVHALMNRIEASKRKDCAEYLDCYLEARDHGMFF